MPTSSIPSLPPDTVPAIAIAATNFISSVSGPLEFLIGVVLAFAIIELIQERLMPSRPEREVPDEDEW